VCWRLCSGVPGVDGRLEASPAVVDAEFALLMLSGASTVAVILFDEVFA